MAQTLVEVVSQETIKPSSPTPQHLRKLKLSYLDQLIGLVYIPLIFFYQADGEAINKGSHVQISQRLKKSLSHTLTSFYPLAGRIQDNFTIDCNDAGVEFIDARAVDHTHELMDVIQEQHNNINLDHLKQYFPVDPTSTSKPLFLVQTHLLRLRWNYFINAWAHANGTDDHPTPARPISFDLANYFPGTEYRRYGFVTRHGEKFRTKRFVLDKVKLEALRKLADDSNVKKPTRVELISAFIWQNFMQLSSSSDGDHNNDKIFCAGHAVNLRARNKSFENVFGNCVVVTIASEKSSSSLEFHEVVSKLIEKRDTEGRQRLHHEIDATKWGRWFVERFERVR
ncbi:hypothetical protein CASFOL_035004 [Castilleja foliolosa]|uniref:Uncharacterized protein n=1 Tax=Castilleja foliolosa TaxID=1961234 RepID=A0ABD3BS54_9LAMI